MLASVFALVRQSTGVVFLTYTASFPLHTTGTSLVDPAGEPEQVSHAKVRSPRRDGNERINGTHARPGGREPP